MKNKISISNYDPRWPLLYEEEKALILGAIGDKIVAIEHVGSTAVPGLGAKPVIDIMVAVEKLADVEDFVTPLAAIGYKPEKEVTIPDRRFFNKGPQERHRHLHISEMNSEFWKRHIVFRDYLRAHPETVREYYDLKRRLAVKFEDDREAYTDAKSAFIEEVIREALKRDGSDVKG